MTNVILSPISLESLEQLILKSVRAALTQSQPSVAAPSEESVKFTISELAEYLNCTRATVHNYKNRNVFKYYQTGRSVYFKKSEVDAALAVNGNRKRA